jgi:hypothetical protein
VVTPRRLAGGALLTDATGTAPLGGFYGVEIQDASGNTIGGSAAGARNVISANRTGVFMTNGYKERVGGNTVAGNYIGADATGNAAMGNVDGVVVLATRYAGDGSSVDGNVIGGSTTGARNVISSNTGWGVIFDDSITDSALSGDFVGNAILGNYIGTNAAGDTALPNGGGVQFLEGPSAFSNSIGGTGAGQRNVISGNAGWGVLLSAGTMQANDANHDVSVAGNYIGTKSGGNKALGNGSGGVRLEAGVQEAGVSSNRIAFNGGPGVIVDGTPNQHGFSASGDSILGNSMFNNTALGIDLLNGGNDDQAAPAIESVTTDGGSTTIGGTLDSTPSATFRIELFSSPNCDPSGAGEGKTFVGSVDATTDGAGHATFSTSVPAVQAGQAMTATATSQANGDTSEFSTCFTSP